jgi:hypothetical protein
VASTVGLDCFVLAWFLLIQRKYKTTSTVIHCHRVDYNFVSEIVISKVNLLSCHIVVASSKESDQTEIDKTVQPARVMLLISLVVALTRDACEGWNY